MERDPGSRSRAESPVNESYLVQDLVFAARQLRKQPLVTACTAAIIAVGICAITTIFSVANALLLTPGAGIGHPRELVNVLATNVRGSGDQPLSRPSYERLRQRPRGLRSLSAFAISRVDVGVATDERRETVNALLVSGNYFSTLEVNAALGRVLGPADDGEAMATPVAVLSHDYWKAHFQADRAIVGKVVQLSGQPFQVVGVAADGFVGTTPALRIDVFAPIAMQPALRKSSGDIVNNASAYWLSAVGRIAPGGTRDEVARALTRDLRNEQGALGVAAAKTEVHVTPLRPVPVEVESAVEIFIAALMGVSILLLSITSLNVGSLLLASGIARRKEFVTRLALGASRIRLMRQLLTETILLFLIGALGGVGLTAAIVHALNGTTIAADVPVQLSVSIDARVLAFTLAVSLCSGVLFGLAPALSASRANPAAAFRADSSGAGTKHKRTRNTFVIGQLAVATLLLVVAGLFARAMHRGQTVGPGFRFVGVTVADLDLSSAGYDSLEAQRFMTRVLDEMRSVPGVDAVGLTSVLPLSGSSRGTEITVPGSDERDAQTGSPVMLATVSPGYFAAIGLPITGGRVFQPTDTRDSPAVAIVTTEFAQRFWHRADAVGTRFAMGTREYTVIGMTRDARFLSRSQAPQAFLFLSHQQDLHQAMTLVVHSTAGSPSVEREFDATLRALAPTLPRQKIRSFDEATQADFLPQKIAALVSSIMGLVGLALSATGLYGTSAFGIEQRQRELATRIALGASPQRVVRLVVAQGTILGLIGLGIGFLLALAASRLLSALLFGIHPNDLFTFLMVLAAVGAIVPLATWIPARRIARLSPARALAEG
jgi:predicted permease